MGAKPSDDSYSEQETARRRDAVLKRMLNTPPKPHSEMKIGKKRKPGEPSSRRSSRQKRDDRSKPT